MRRIPLLLVVLVLLVPSASLGQELAAPEEGKARVYFFYFLGAIVGRGPVDVYAGDQYMGRVGSSEYWGFDLEPGEHLLWTKFGNKKWFLRAELEPDHVYYVHINMTPPKWNPNPVPAPVLYHASRNDKKGKRTLKWIEDRLKKNKFTAAVNSDEELASTGSSTTESIAEVLAQWESEWSKNTKKWDSLKPGDHVD